MVVRVEDTGRAFRREKIDAIFEPFVQVDAQLTRTQDGVGLGLSISRDLARGMGGDLVAESRVGKGSTFTLTLASRAINSRHRVARHMRAQVRAVQSVVEKRKWM